MTGETEVWEYDSTATNRSWIKYRQVSNLEHIGQHNNILQLRFQTGFNYITMDTTRFQIGFRGIVMDTPRFQTGFSGIAMDTTRFLTGFSGIAMDTMENKNRLVR